MYSTGDSLSAKVLDNTPETGWHPKGSANSIRNGKGFVRCRCPRCSSHHRVYMLWTGRGVPRKYCVNCKPLISGYDDAAINEASISTVGHSKKTGRSYENES